MRADSVQAVIESLNTVQARYLVVGGLAVVAHGYVRYTVDVDLVIALDTENVRRSLGALAQLGYRPRAPVPIEDFAKAELRESWVREKGMVVFQLFSDQHIETPIDVFVSMPFDFEHQWARVEWLSVVEATEAPVVALDELLAMKAAVGRDQDLIDIGKLRKLHEENRKGAP